MVKQVFEYLAEKLAALQMFELVIPIAEIIDKMDGSFPAYYIGKGNYRPIDLSGYAGVGYFRKLSAAQFAKSDRETFVGSETLEEVTIPVRLVLSIKKDILNIDTGFASSYLFEEMIRVFSGNHPLLADKAGVSDVEVFMKDSEDDRLKIFAQEYTGSTLRELPYDWIMVMVDMDVKLTFNKNCINKFCDGYASDGCSPVITPTPTPCPDPEPCPDCPECFEVEGAICDYELHVFVAADDPEAAWLHTITREAGADILISDHGDTFSSSSTHIAIQDALTAAGIVNTTVEVNRIFDTSPPEFVIVVLGSSAILTTGAAKLRGAGADLPAENFVRSNCRVPDCPECPEFDLTTIEGIRCDYSAFLTTEQSPGDVFIYKITVEGYPDVMVDDIGVGINTFQCWVNARNALITAGIDVYNVTHDYMGTGEIVFQKVDGKLLTIALKVRGGDPEPDIAFTQSNCACYCAPCPSCPDCQNVWAENEMLGGDGAPTFATAVAEEWTVEGSGNKMLTYNGPIEEGNHEMVVTVPGINTTGLVMIQFHSNRSRVWLRPFTADGGDPMVAVDDKGSKYHTLMVYVTGNRNTMEFLSDDAEGGLVIDEIQVRYFNCTIPTFDE